MPAPWLGLRADFPFGEALLTLLVHQGSIMFPDMGDGLLLGKATFLKSLDADQGLTKRRAQKLVR